MDDKQVRQNESIKDGLEKFLDQQMFGLDDIPKKEVKTEFANTAPIDVRRNVENMLQESDKQMSHRNGNSVNRQKQSDRTAGYQNNRQDTGHQNKWQDTGYHNRYASQAYEEEKEDDYEKIDYNKKTYEKKQMQGRKTSSKSSDSSRRVKNEKTKKNGHTSDVKSKASSAASGEKKSNRNRKKNGKEKKKPMSKWKKVLLIILVVVLALLAWWYIMVVNVYQKMNYEKSDDIIEGAMKEDGVINVLLIGNDSRENGEDGRSDAMILVSISEKTKKIYMTSLLRDMYVEIPGHDGNRLNAAYSYGGPALLCETIEQNFDIEINRYAIVNFQAFASLVDAVGGVDLELTNEEVQWVNAYLNEYNLLENREITTDYLDTSLSGVIHLNGPQALAYCRNRYIGTDFGRTQRQRNVLSAIAKKLPLAMATNSSEVIEGLFPNLTTNIKQTEVYRLSLNAAKYLTYDMEQMAIPADGTYSNATIRKMMVLQVDFEANKKIIKEKIYGEGTDDDI